MRPMSSPEPQPQQQYQPHIQTPMHPRRGRRAAAFVAAVVAAVSVPVVVQASAATATALADWRDGFGGWDSHAQPTRPWTGSQQSQTTVDSRSATDAESRGVVLIDTKLAYAGESGAGTGLVLTSSGEVLTNYHVVEGATLVKVTVATTGQTYRATVVGHDAKSDVAVLQLKNASGLATVTLDNDPVVAGDAVTAVGNATNGTVALAASTVTFTPAANFAGTATFEYTISDGTTTDVGVVTVTVTVT